MLNPLEEIKNLIESNIANSVVQVSDMTGTLDHLQILVASDLFEGKMLLDQHQMVMDILKEPLSDKLHAVKLKTMTLQKYKQKFS